MTGTMPTETDLQRTVDALRRELAEARAEQSASADVLKIINRSALELEPALIAICETAARLCGADQAAIFRREGDLYGFAAAFGFPAEYEQAWRAAGPGRTDPDSPLPGARSVALRRPVHVLDVTAEPGYLASASRGSQARTSLGIPLLRDGEPIGNFVLGRRRVEAFTDRQIELVQTFADQAVIAIENSRLFDEVQARTRDLSESLQQQTATAEVLKVISRSTFDLPTVLKTLVESAVTLAGGRTGTIFQRRGDLYHIMAEYGRSPEMMAYGRANPIKPGVETAVGRTALTGAVVQIPDVLADPDWNGHGFQRLGNFRSILGIPIIRDGKVEGVFSLAKPEPEEFGPRQIELVQTFADQAVIAIENARLFSEVQAKTHEVEEALRYQTGSANILNVIAASPTDVQPVLKAIVESACELCEAYDAVVLLNEGEHLLFSAHHGPIPVQVRKRPIDRKWTAGRAFIDKKAVHVHDLQTAQDEFPDGMEMAIAGGYHSIISVPLLREGESIGALTLRRVEVHPFSDKQVALLQTFADQAVIALGNVGLFNEVRAKTRDLEEALRYQTGSANILNVIASSPTDVQPVLKAIVESACELCEAYDAVALLKEGDHLLFSAHHGPIPMSFAKWPINRQWTAGRAFVDRKAVHVPDLLAEQNEFPDGLELAKSMGHRSIVSVPLLRESESIGALVLRRTEVNPFSDKQIALLQTFADQAVIALGNVRLFEEVQARTRDLQESLQQQTATADVLKVISRSTFDLQPVLDTLISSASRLCEANIGTIRYQDGSTYRLAADYGCTPEWHDHLAHQSPKPDRGTIFGRTIVESGTVHIPDVLADPEFTRLEAQKLMGFRAALGVPLIREGQVFGVLSLLRSAPRSFTEKQIELVETFADQAVIAIENVRLFEEVQARTRDLQESLQQQTATADVLKVISRSAFDLQTVLDTLVESAARLCEADEGAIFRPTEGGTYRLGAGFGMTPTKFAFLQSQTIDPGSKTSIAARALREGRVVQIEDAPATPELVFEHEPDPARTRLGVPLLREGAPIGAFVLVRREVHPFTDKQIELVQTFADQAVIAIENVRLFDEVQARTRDLQESLQQQTATADVLKVISRSTFDLQAVLDTLVESATHLCEADHAWLFQRKDDLLYFSSSFGHGTAVHERIREFFLPQEVRIERGSIVGRSASEGRVVHVADVLGDPEYTWSEAQKIGGYRAALGAPLLREGKVVGVIFVARTKPEPYSAKQIELVTTFADQAVIAIENVRLFDEVQARTRELAQSLDDLRTAQDRLVQTEKLASLGQLTAGIAHEIKNPLNFVNNFAALSIELTDELNDVLKQASLADKLRAEADELTGFLKDNLAKVVQHGKRADSIVKNMLLHSREGSGEHRPADINALVDESLNLAYHGARAEKPQFNVTLQRNFDPEAGMVDVFPQEITRVFLNLLSNGFYAVTKRKVDNEAGFEPVVSAMTRGRTDGVEIRIRDNGTGIPPEVREKMFNPFFTTKPAGEGTGLGLSMSYDIIVKQHGGTIDVDTMPGEFTEFTIVLPRTSLSKKN
jgi:GAF domain-containing protein